MPIIFVVFMVIGGFLHMIPPETNRRRLPEFIREANVAEYVILLYILTFNLVRCICNPSTNIEAVVDVIKQPLISMAYDGQFPQTERQVFCLFCSDYYLVGINVLYNFSIINLTIPHNSFVTQSIARICAYP